jgi:hypothetical protein
MIDVTAIARCHRCNVISLPLYPNRSDPTHASVSLPFEWLGGRLYTDGEDTDFTLCPECTREAWEWLTTKVERRPSSDGMCLALHYAADGRRFCDLPKGHDGHHSEASRG